MRLRLQVDTLHCWYVAPYAMSVRHSVHFIHASRASLMPGTVPRATTRVAMTATGEMTATGDRSARIGDVVVRSRSGRAAAAAERDQHAEREGQAPARAAAGLAAAPLVAD